MVTPLSYTFPPSSSSICLFLFQFIVQLHVSLHEQQARHPAESWKCLHTQLLNAGVWRSVGRAIAA